MNILRFIFILIGLALGLLTGITEAQAKVKKSIIATAYCENNMALLDQSPVSLEGNQADRIVISKARRKLYLLNEGRVVRTYNVAFGFGLGGGAKYRAGDGRTPEGLYEVELKNPKSKYHRGLRVSYPNEADKNFAENLGVHPGGDIMIHGFPVGFIDGLVPAVVKAQHPVADWTQGCVAVTDQEIEEIYALVKVKTPIEICGL